MLETITIEPKKNAQSCVICLHGLGADGHDFTPIIPKLGLPKDHRIRFIFPHAPYRPVTINGQKEMRAWYDIFDLERLDHEDELGIQHTCRDINKIIQQQNISSERIVIAGFSQGGAIALFIGTTALQNYAGIIALSTYLPFLRACDKRPTIKNLNLAILQCHGIYDPIIPISVGKAAYDYLKTEINTIEWKEYKMGHQICDDEIQYIGKWLAKKLF